MRLLMVAESGTPHTHKWAHYFQDQGDDVVVVSQTNDPIEGVKVIQFPPLNAWWSKLPRVRFGGGWQRWLAGWLQWRRILAEFKPDIVHIHFIPGDARNYFYYRGVKHLIVSTYGSDVVFEPHQPPSRATTNRIRSLLNQADIVTATTQFLARETRKFLPSDKPIHVIAFGVDCEQFRPGPSRTPDSLRPVILGFVKHLEAKYGPDVLLEAFAIIQGYYPCTRLVIAGRGSMEAQLRRQARALGLAEQVDFVGRVPHEDVPKFMQEFDIFVMPTICREAFGVAAIEASACEVPVVATNVGGVPEAVIHGETGILVPPRDPKALAQACIELIKQPERRRILGKAGRKFVLDRYRWEDTAGQMKALYDSILYL